MNWLLYLCLVWTLHYTKGHFRLPGDVFPTQYDLKLLFDVDVSTNFSFYGVVDILLQAVKPVSKIALNSNGIQFLKKDLKLTVISGSERANNAIDIDGVTVDEENQLLILLFDAKLELDVVYSLSLAFYGNLSMHQGPGVYGKSLTMESTGFEQYDSTPEHRYFLVGTNFEPTGARTLFPCFDEPEYKAMFTLTIGHHKDYIAISNMPITSSTPDESLEEYFRWTDIEKTFWNSKESYVWDHFQKTGMISTYLVGFVIFKYTHIENVDHPVVKSAVWTMLDLQNHPYIKVASVIASNALFYYEAYFNIPCDLPKIDHVFHKGYETVSSTGLGLINYAEVLLHDERKPLFKERILLNQVMSKEMALQWLGNTIKWWNDQWLKEGLAIYLSKLSLDTLLNEDSVPDTALMLSPLMEVLEENALESTNPIKSPMEMTHPMSINDYSKRIQHNKVAFLFRMLHRVLGDNIFKDALHNFLVKYSFRNTDPDDLWDEMSKSRLSLGGQLWNNTEKMVMDSWITQPGYPLITVTRDYNSSSLSLTQIRYMSQEDVSTPAQQGWWVPLRITTQGGEKTAMRDWIADDEGVTNFVDFEHETDANSWLLLNADMIAPCRINYDSRNWEMLAAALHVSQNLKSIPTFSRVQLLADAFEFAKTGRIEFELVIKLASYLMYEPDPDVLENGFNQLFSLGLMLRRTPDYEGFERFVQAIIHNHKSESGPYLCLFLAEQVNYKNLKLCIVLYEWGFVMNDKEYTSFLVKQFEESMRTVPRVELWVAPHLHKLIFCAGVGHGSKFDWDFIFDKIHGNTVTITDKINLINGLACTREPWLLHRTLELLVEGNFNIAPNVPTIIKTALHNPVGYYVGKEFIYKRSKEIFTGYSAQATTIALITHLLDQVSEQQDLLEGAATYDEIKKQTDKQFKQDCI